MIVHKISTAALVVLLMCVLAITFSYQATQLAQNPWMLYGYTGCQSYCDLDCPCGSTDCGCTCKQCPEDDPDLCKNPCNDNNVCTVDSCNTEVGCQYKAIQCDDNDPCTVDSCDSSIGCQHVETPECACKYVNCDDYNQCTADTCDIHGTCQHSLFSCNDGNDCTVDSCSPQYGCQYLPIPGCRTNMSNADAVCDAAPTCDAPDQGCVRKYKYDPNGCIIGCGSVVCNEADTADTSPIQDCTACDSITCIETESCYVSPYSVGCFPPGLIRAGWQECLVEEEEPSEEEPVDVFEALEAVEVEVPVAEEEEPTEEVVPTIVCGDGILDASEECESDTDCTLGARCTDQCRCMESLSLSVCGNDIVEFPEECEPPDTDECSTDCKLIQPGYCGDGIVEGFEECEPPGQTICNDLCRIQILKLVAGEEEIVEEEPPEEEVYMPECGNGILDENEECEPDLEDDSGQECNEDCHYVVHYCGDGVLDTGEQCDTGPQKQDTPDAFCRSDCTLPRCGDGIVDITESCDDGNLVPGDGCSESCIPETDLHAAAQTYASLIPLQSLPLASITIPQPALGETGPATIMFVTMGAAAGIGVMRKRRK